MGKLDSRSHESYQDHLLPLKDGKHLVGISETIPDKEDFLNRFGEGLPITSKVDEYGKPGAQTRWVSLLVHVVQKTVDTYSEFFIMGIEANSGLYFSGLIHLYPSSSDRRLNLLISDVPPAGFNPQGTNEKHGG